MESICIRVQFSDKTVKLLTSETGKILMDILHKNGIPLAAPCGGSGRCKACQVTVLLQGRRESILACQYIPQDGDTIFLSTEWKDGGKSAILTSGQQRKKEKSSSNSGTRYGAAIDIGTTTIGFSLIDLDCGTVEREFGCMNSQRIHGSDVTARILYASTKEGLHSLSQLIKHDLKKGLKNLTTGGEAIHAVAIAANTVMLYLLREIDPSPLGQFPFTASFLGEYKTSLEELLEEEGDQTPVYLLPGSSAYVGADITAGVAFTAVDKKDTPSLFVDMGTNGEMVLGNKEHLLSTSTAAGPAFEASFRSQGVKGARGIDFIAQALHRGFLDHTGLVAKRYFETGIPLSDGITLSQQTIREIQLAKGAICSGIEILAKEYGVSLSEIEQVYLAGGFGFHLTVENAVLIGLIPKALKNKIKIAGNTSLLGAGAFLQSSSFRETCRRTALRIKNIDLANVPEFNEHFVQRMDFKRY